MIPALLIFATSTLPIFSPTQTTRLFEPYVPTRIASAQMEAMATGIPAAYILQLFNDPRTVIFDPPVISTSTEPAPGIDWDLVERNMLTRASLQQGKDFIAANLATLKKAEKKYGVSKESLTTVIRIETNFGAMTGNYPVFNVFLSEVVNAKSEARWLWGKQNLTSLINYCHRTQIDCLALNGSYAGAFGLSQFLPYSVEQWGVDGNGDGKIDLFNPEDVIPSTANFLKAHGWGKTTKSRMKALGLYYGSPANYPRIAINYGEALKKPIPKTLATNR